MTAPRRIHQHLALLGVLRERGSERVERVAARRDGVQERQSEMVEQRLARGFEQGREHGSERLDHAGAANKSRIYGFDRNPAVLYQVIPQDFEQMPPQPRNMAFLINCHMRWGGCVSPYPKGVAYMDGTGAAS